MRPSKLCATEEEEANPLLLSEDLENLVVDIEDHHFDLLCPSLLSPLSECESGYDSAMSTAGMSPSTVVEEPSPMAIEAAMASGASLTDLFPDLI